MKKNLILISGLLLIMNTGFAGGIVTNTNQSAQFARILSRNASTDLDAVYYNPAGLTRMQNGFYFALDNQSIFQTQNINSEFPFLNTHDYKGTVTVPIFPSAFAVYKKDKWAFSLGFGPNGGGGTAKFDKGLPSFEKPISALANMLGTKYTTDLSLVATTVIWGIQLGATYKINEIVSIFGGVRYLPATNIYKGSITNIQFQSAGGMVDGQTFLAGFAGQTASQLQPLASAGGGLTIAQAQDAGYLPAPIAEKLKAGLKLVGVPQTQIEAMTISSVQAAYTNASQHPEVFAPLVGDKNVDVKQTGMGFTPIIGVDIHLDKLNVGLKFEYQPTLVLTNSTKVDGTGLFPDKGKSGSDLPSIIAGGADYQLLDKLKISGSFNVYLDKLVGWGPNVYGQHRSIDKNYVELALGAEYKLTDKFAVSAGYLNSNTGVSEAYQSDFSYSNDAYTTGLGFQWNISKKLVLDAGMMLTTYKDAIKTFNSSFDPLATSLGSAYKPYKETYGKDTFTFAFGIGYKIF